MPDVPEPSSPPASDHRERLLAGLARAVAASGFAALTIADIVREAGVSRRTFYEHFDTKADCLIALYEAASDEALAQLRAAVDPDRDWPGQVEQAVAAYLGHLSQRPQLLRALLVDIVALGPQGLAARRRVHRQIGQFMLESMDRGRPPRTAPLPPELATAVVAGIHELMLQAIEADAGADLSALVAPASALVRALAQVQV